jgi:hypothetical protein
MSGQPKVHLYEPMKLGNALIDCTACGRVFNADTTTLRVTTERERVTCRKCDKHPERAP